MECDESACVRTSLPPLERLNMKYDTGKTQFALVPPESLKEVADVFTFGAAKYGANNWRDDGGNTSHLRTYNSIQRHLNAWLASEDIDPESGMTHLAHAATQVMILMIHTKFHPEMDDRYKPATKQDTNNVA
jgi:hypothetical protein